MIAIQIEGLGKAYARYPNRWSRLFEWFNPRSQSGHNLHWVLRDLNIQIQSGQAVAIIGMNGAGKSTLLKLISNTLQPTEGKIAIQGSVAALLELGMGFHPDFTGRENVKMGAQLLGITPDELNELMPQIEAFADIGSYIDQPFRVYSSGMQVRLAFSLATAKRPDILIVDEALSVGDSAFQQKSFSRIQSFCKQGTTLLLVSHDQSTIANLCDHVILLESGRILKEGPPASLFDFYNQLLAMRNAKLLNQQDTNLLENFATTSVDGLILLDMRLRSPTNSDALRAIGVGDSTTLFVQAKLAGQATSLVMAYEIKNRFGQCVFSMSTAANGIVDLARLENPSTSLAKVFEWNINFAMNVGAGQYSLSIAIVEHEEQLADRQNWQDLAYCFEVVNLKHPRFEGQAWLNPQLTVLEG